MTAESIDGMSPAEYRQFYADLCADHPEKFPTLLRLSIIPPQLFSWLDHVVLPKLEAMQRAYSLTDEEEAAWVETIKQLYPPPPVGPTEWRETERKRKLLGLSDRQER